MNFEYSSVTKRLDIQREIVSIFVDCYAFMKKQVFKSFPSSLLFFVTFTDNFDDLGGELHKRSGMPSKHLYQIAESAQRKRRTIERLYLILTQMARRIASVFPPTEHKYDDYIKNSSIYIFLASIRLFSYLYLLYIPGYKEVKATTFNILSSDGKCIKCIYILTFSCDLSVVKIVLWAILLFASPIQ